MQTDSGGVVPIDNAMNLENACKRDYRPQMSQDLWSPANAPVLMSVSKENYMQNLSNEYNRQSLARSTEHDGLAIAQTPTFKLQERYWNPLSMDNVYNSIWKPIDSKYLN